MPVLSTTKNYADGTLLYASDFNDFLDDIETFFNETKIADVNILNNGLTASDVLADSSITTSKIQDNAITTSKIASDAIDTQHILDANITTGKIIDAAVEYVVVADDAVTTDKINDASVTAAKKPLVYAIGSGSGAAYSITTETTVCSVTLPSTYTGRPVRVGLMANGSSTSSTNGAYLGITTGAHGQNEIGMIIKLKRTVGATTTTISQQIFSRYTGQLSADFLTIIPPGVVSHIDTGATAGTVTYSLTLARISSDTTAVTANHVKLYAWEL